MKVRSTAFGSGEPIPKKYTCQGSDTSPPLTWSDVPPGTRSFALVVEDPDAPDPAAPQRVWTHWIVYDIPPDVTSLEEGIRTLPAGCRTGKNDWQRTDYGGPCPPIGKHRYFHKVYALDDQLGDLGTPSRADIERAMQGHVLAHAELIGTYQKV